jgi:hypothetical protein
LARYLRCLRNRVSTPRSAANWGNVPLPIPLSLPRLWSFGLAPRWDGVRACLASGAWGSRSTGRLSSPSPLLKNKFARPGLLCLCQGLWIRTRKVLCCPRAGTRWRTFRTQRYSKAHRESEEFFRLTGQLAQPNQDYVFSKRATFFNGLKSKVGHSYRGEGHGASGQPQSRSFHPLYSARPYTQL